MTGLLPLMRATFVFCVCALAAFSGEPGAVKLRDGDFLAICGDSITEQKRYSVFIEDYLLMCQPAKNLRVFQFGWSGDTAAGFAGRMEQNVIPFRPSVALTFFGMNDGGYGPILPERRERYRNAMVSIVKKFREAGVEQVMLGTPGVVDSGTYTRASADIYNHTLADLGQVARDTAEKQEVGFADVHDVMLEAMARLKAAHGPGLAFAGDDGVHPGPNGHLVIAYAFLKALGCDGAIGTITWDCASGQAEATAGHKVINASTRALEIESSRYPFVLPDDSSSKSGVREITRFVPFHRDLNRFLLVIKNPPGARVKVTWGNWSHNYSAEELAGGVNLAEDFPDNPFGETFRTVDAAVKAKQIYETDAVKVLLSSIPTWSKYYPQMKDHMDNLKRDVMDRGRSMFDAARSKVVPLTHRLQVEAL